MIRIAKYRGFWLIDETVHVGGSFKIRGVQRLFRSGEAVAPGIPIVTFSSGSHGIAVALLARSIGKKPLCVMPVWAEREKAQVIRRLGAELVLAGDSALECERTALDIARERRAVMLHPFRSRVQIEGYTTLWADINEQFPGGVDVILPVGSGGLMTAGLIYRARINAKYHIVGVEPETCASYSKAISAGRPIVLESRSRAAPALNVNCVPEEWFDLAASPSGCDLARVSDADIMLAAGALNDMGYEVDPAAAAGFAYLLFHHYRARHRDVAIVLTGRGSKVTNAQLDVCGVQGRLAEEISRDCAALRRQHERTVTCP